MSTGSKFAKIAGTALLCVGTLTYAGTAQAHRKPKKPAAPQLPPLPSGPTGRPVPQMPLDSMAAVPPHVSYQNGQLTIVSPNSTLGDILRAVKKQTGAEIEVPAATERVVTTLGPGPAREVIAELLNGSRFNYVLLGSPEDANALTRVVLVAKSGPDNPGSVNAGMQPMQQPQQPYPQQANVAPPPEMAAQDNNDAEAAPEENADDNNADQQAVEAEQQQQPQPEQQPDQQGIKTPQQMLQEMQQRQLMMQQQQPPGQPPIPGSGMPPHPPQNP